MKSPAGKNAKKNTPPVFKITLENMKNYIKYKSFDVIGNGNYRRYVNTCKEKQEKWAAETVRSVHKVASMVKTIHNLVSDLQTNNKLGLYTLCQTVIENNTPPIDQSTVIAECSVSKKQKCQCIVLRCKGRGAPCIMVQSRFGHFVLMLWTVFKIDLVIKTIARDFIESKVNVSKQNKCAWYCW
jgi:hypothetical protein